MTKEELIKNALPIEEWKRRHTKYIETGLKELEPYFDYKRFCNDYKAKADADVMKTIIVDAFNNDNYDIGEFEDQLARVLSIEYKKIFEYRTDLYWQEIARGEAAV